MWLALLLSGMALCGTGAALGTRSAWIGIGLPALGLLLILAAALLSVRLAREDAPAEEDRR